MNKKKLIALISVCVIAVVSIAIVPTYAAYYDEIEFSATIQARSFAIDTVKTDLLNIKTAVDETFSYGFFTSSDIGNCDFYFSIETSGLQDCTIELSKRDESTREYNPVTTLSTGKFVDENRYAAGEKRLYRLEITPNSENINASSVLARFSSQISDVEVPEMPLPPNGAGFDLIIPDLSINDVINKTVSGYRIVDINFLPRTDSINLLMFNATPVDKDEPTTPYASVLDSTSKLSDAIQIINYKDGVRGVAPSDETPSRVVDVILTIYLPTNIPLKNIDYSIDYSPKNDDFELVLDDIIADSILIDCPKHLKDSSVSFTFTNVGNFKFSKVSLDLIKGSVTLKATDKFPNAFELLDSFQVYFPENNSGNFLTFKINSKIITKQTVNDYFEIISDGIEASINFVE